MFPSINNYYHNYHICERAVKSVRCSEIPAGSISKFAVMKRWIFSAGLMVTLTSITYAQYENLVLEGGGIRGIAFTGALKVLEEKQVLPQIEKVAGTSVGAIVGALISVGYSSDELRNIMFDLKVQTFNDGEGFFIGGQKRLRNHYGWYKGDELENWMGELIRRKTGSSDLSFQQLHNMHLQNSSYKDLYVTSTNLTLQRAETFCWTTMPDMKIKTAVRISASVPLYFSATFLDNAGNIVKHPGLSKNHQVYVDGGILQNYPINMFDSSANEITVPGNEHTINSKTLGLKLERPEQISHYNSNNDIAPYNINSLKNYVGALYNIVIENLNRKQSYQDECFRTVYISTNNISPKVKKVSVNHKQLLYDNGREAAEKFFGQ